MEDNHNKEYTLLPQETKCHMICHIFRITKFLAAHNKASFVIYKKINTFKFDMIEGSCNHIVSKFFPPYAYVPESDVGYVFKLLRTHADPTLKPVLTYIKKTCEIPYSNMEPLHESIERASRKCTGKIFERDETQVNFDTPYLTYFFKTISKEYI
ncbi:hypothetical protein BpHYR1_048359 [Brachionus plicatilis]|uniref:Uncharacterized protein n=1 Tax=Brachionus plicatilis TaxID=10195 RepID=A0A3M7QK83_BRAPC|nr:hypothetical protein BpHYR1_048359 [Brachionus plicatilis]